MTFIFQSYTQSIQKQNLSKQQYSIQLHTSMIQHRNIQPFRRDQSIARGALEVSGIVLQVRQPQAIVHAIPDPPLPVQSDAIKAQNKNKYQFGVKAIIASVIATAIIVISLSIGINYSIVISNRQNSTDNSMNIDQIATLYQSLSITDIRTNCGDWGSNFLYLYQNSCTGCSGSLTNSICSSCSSDKNGTKTVGTSCSGCNMTSSTTAYCGYCANCSFSSKSIICYSRFSYITYTYPQLNINATSCSGCYGSYCTICTDSTISSQSASSCYNCILNNNAKGYCSYCSTCLF